MTSCVASAVTSYLVTQTPQGPGLTTIVSAAADKERFDTRLGLLGDTAAAVDLSTTSVTYYYKKKDDLADALLQAGANRKGGDVGVAR